MAHNSGKGAMRSEASGLPGEDRLANNRFQKRLWKDAFDDRDEGVDQGAQVVEITVLDAPP